MSATVLHMSMSLDGFVAGPNEGPDTPLGDGGEGEEAPETGDSLEVRVARLEAEVRELREVLHGF